MTYAHIKCPNCKRVVAETTEQFDPDARPTGAMLRLIDPWKAWGWETVICWTNATMCSQIFCPNCEYPLAPNGRLNLVDPATPAKVKKPGDKPDRSAEARKAAQAEIERIMTEDEEPEPAEASCPKCGKTESQFKNRSGFVNHCRVCKGS